MGQLYSYYVEEKSHGLNSTQNKLKQQGYAIEIPRTRLGYSSQEPVLISTKGKGKKATAQHITFEVDEGEKLEPVSRSSVFDHLGTSTPRELVFYKLSISLPTRKVECLNSALDHSLSNSMDPILELQKTLLCHLPSCLLIFQLTLEAEAIVI